MTSISLILLLFVTFAPAGDPPATQPARVFAPDSFWYQAIPADAPLHPNSAAFVQDFLRQRKSFYGTISINTVDYASPVYVVDANVPTVRVTESPEHAKGHPNQQLAEQWAAVPIPSYAEPANGTDSEMTIYQPVTDTIWEFWQAKKVDGQWQANWGGKMTHASKSDGIWPKFFGTTATGLPFLGGQITPDELRAGEINHVMGIALVEVETWKVKSWPAFRSDGWNPKNAPNRIPEGLRFRLDPTVDVEKLHLPPVGRMIARAAQKYGFVVWDVAGGITLRAQNPKSWTTRGLPDPYPELFNHQPNWSILQNFSWDKIQFLPMDYGKK